MHWKKRKTHAIFLSTLDTNVYGAKTHFCFCDLNSVETPMLSGCVTQISGKAFHKVCNK